MYKYWLLIKQTWQNYFVWRTSFVMWRFRQFMSSLMSLTIWQVIFTGQNQVFGYQDQQMITYVFLSSLLFNIMLTSALGNLPNRIYSGHISFELLKPVNLFSLLAAEEVGDKALNIGFVVVESLILYLIFQPSFIWPSLSVGLIFGGWVMLGTLLNFIITLLFGTIGFWSPDAWGPKFLFFIMLDFTAGKLYPLDILPTAIQHVINLTPFPYLSYTQTQLFLGRLTTDQILPLTLTMITWILSLGIIFKILWNKGIKNYAAMGQ